MQGHTMDKCWKIHDYPPRFKNNIWKENAIHSSKANTSINNIDDQGNKRVETKLTEEQYSRLMSILNGKDSIISNVQEVSHTSNAIQLTSMQSSNYNDMNWIIDSGATDHMCCQSFSFDFLKPLTNKQHTIIVPNGGKIKVTHSGNIILENGICLKEVVYVPDFIYNLYLYISCVLILSVVSLLY